MPGAAAVAYEDVLAAKFVVLGRERDGCIGQQNEQALGEISRIVGMVNVIFLNDMSLGYILLFVLLMSVCAFSLL